MCFFDGLDHWICIEIIYYRVWGVNHSFPESLNVQGILMKKLVHLWVPWTLNELILEWLSKTEIKRNSSRKFVCVFCFIRPVFKAKGYISNNVTIFLSLLKMLSVVKLITKAVLQYYASLCDNRIPKVFVFNCHEVFVRFIRPEKYASPPFDCSEFLNNSRTTVTEYWVTIVCAGGYLAQ
jgi:hypothetical protein